MPYFNFHLSKDFLVFIFELNYFDYYFIWGFSYPFVCYENCVFALNPEQHL
jgi:hypothetical protein